MTRCEYTLDPDDPETWHGSPGEQCHISSAAVNTEGVWNCPYDAVAGEKHCLFHLPASQKSNEAVEKAFIDAIESTPASTTETEPSKHRFIGAEFGEFKLIEESIEAQSTGIDLSYAQVSGEFDLSRSVVDAETLYCIGTQFESDTRFEKTTFGGYVAFLGTSFGGPSAFDGVTVQGEADFRRATFIDSAGFADARMEKRADFSSAQFGGNFSMRGTVVGGDLVLRRAVCRQHLDLSAATISGDADLMAMKLQGEGTFDEITIDGETTLQFASLDGVDKSGLL